MYFYVQKVLRHIKVVNGIQNYENQNPFPANKSKVYIYIFCKYIFSKEYHPSWSKGMGLSLSYF